MSDGALLKSYADGNLAAFDCLYRRHKNKLFMYVRRQCPTHELAEDIAHDTWLGVIRQSGNYSPSAKFTTWLYRIAHNRLVDLWRKHSAPGYLLIDDLAEQLAAKDQSYLALKELLQSLQALPETQMEALLLKIEGFSHAEIAAITESKQETVKSRLRYATRSLKSMEVQA